MPNSEFLIKEFESKSNGDASLIFSYWPSTLDLLAGLLRKAQIQCLQIDGRTSYPERSKRLTAFREDERRPVLLMSIETGAVG